MSIKNELLKEYLELGKEIKSLEKRYDVIRVELIKMGSFGTQDYVCAVEEKTRRSMAALSVCVEALTEDVLRNKGLINEISYRTVKVTEKEK